MDSGEELEGIVPQTDGREPGVFTRVRVARYCASQLPWITAAICRSVLKSLVAIHGQTSADHEGPPRGVEELCASPEVQIPVSQCRDGRKTGRHSRGTLPPSPASRRAGMFHAPTSTMSALTPVKFQTFCLYKGLCTYYAVGEAHLAAWSYPDAYAGVGRISNLVSFDIVSVHLDGAQLPSQAGPRRSFRTAPIATSTSPR